MKLILNIAATSLACMLACAAQAADKAPELQNAGYATTAQATKALYNAIRSNNRQQLHQVLGQEADPYVFGKDGSVDREAHARFVYAYQQHLRIEQKDATHAIVHVGKDDWPLPFPLVKTDTRWHFDTVAGIQEWRDRRLGENELSAIQISLAYVDAQREYVQHEHQHDGLLEYAQHIVSSEGKHDGLYWPAKAGERRSPMGQAFASANAKGRTLPDLELRPFHGYRFRVLTAQGAAAPGGALDYLVNGKLIGGFALIATPAEYGESGIKSFIVNHQGKVYSKDLGADTTRLGAAITSYDPDPSWQKEDF
jgi:hypothetical protein